MQAIQACVTLIKDILTGLAAGVASIIGILGFNTWKAQLHWKRQYEVAQRLSKATYMVRNALAHVRDPFGYEGELQQATKEVKVEGDPWDNTEKFIHTQRAVYSWRWQEVHKALVELDAVSLEAEAIWGKVVREELAPLYLCAKTLFNTLQIQFKKMEHPEIYFSKDADQREVQVMYDRPGEQDNFFSSEITNAVSKIEDFLKLYLKI